MGGALARWRFPFELKSFKIQLCKDFIQNSWHSRKANSLLWL